MKEKERRKKERGWLGRGGGQSKKERDERLKERKREKDERKREKDERKREGGERDVKDRAPTL